MDLWIALIEMTSTSPIYFTKGWNFFPKIHRIENKWRTSVTFSDGHFATYMPCFVSDIICYVCYVMF